jgi:hypothetical protein
LACDGHDDLIGVFPSCAQSSLPFAEPHLGLPTDILEAFGRLFQTSWERSTHLRRVAIGPGAFDQGASGRGMASLGAASLTTALATGIFRRGEAEITHEWSGLVKTGEVTECGHDGHGDGELHPTQGLEGFDHGAQAPGLYLIFACLLKTLEAFGVLVDGSDVFWEDDLRRWYGTDDLREPAQVGRAPGGPACLADIVSQKKGFETACGGLEIA